MRKRHLDNQGSALVVVLAILSLLALLGAAGLSTAVVNVQMRSMSRMSDKNFYKLEAIWDEIYEKLGYQISDILKEDYAEVLAKLYSVYKTNTDANTALRQKFRNHEILVDAMSDTASAETFLKGLYTEADCEQLSISIGTVTERDNGWKLDDLVLTYADPSTGIETSISMNLEISVPDIRFIDSTKIYSDYILIANGPITVQKTSNHVDGIQPVITGSVRGSVIDIREKSEVVMTGNDIIAGNNSTNSESYTVSNTSDIGKILISGGSKLTIGTESVAEENSPTAQTAESDDSGDTQSGDADDEYANNVWAENIVLSGQNQTALNTKSANLYIKDDLTISGSGNQVNLEGGSYYGYGNEGSYDPAKSSAIILNGTNNTIQMNLNSLTLAGRSYLRIGDALTYPMAESIAQKSTQSIYLVPAKDIEIEGVSAQITNPWILASDTKSQTVRITDGNQDITCSLAFEDADQILGGDAGDKVVFLKKTTNGITKVYAFYNANYTKNTENTETTPDLKAFFKDLLAMDANSAQFQSLLQKGSNIINIGNAPGVQENGHNVASAGAVYREVTDEPYEILDTASTSSYGILKGIAELKQDYAALRSSLSRTGRIDVEEAQLSKLPVSQYATEPEGAYWFTCDGQAVRCNSTVEINGNATRTGIILADSSGVTITGDGSFEGLIISFGPITVSGSTTLTADPEVVKECLTNGDTAKEYFRETYDTAATVFNDYSWFIRESDWTRGRR